MSASARWRAAVAGALTAAILGALAANPRAGVQTVDGRPDPLPEGDGRAAVVTMCSDCHGIGPSIVRRHNRIEWQAIVDEMHDKGAPGSDDDVRLAVAYLTKFFGPVNINTAPAEEIQRVLELSADEAKAIVAWRATHPPFTSIDDVKKVEGVDAAKIEKTKIRIVLTGK